MLPSVVSLAVPPQKPPHDTSLKNPQASLALDPSQIQLRKDSNPLPPQSNRYTIRYLGFGQTVADSNFKLNKLTTGIL